MVNFYTKASKNIFNIKTLISYLVKGLVLRIFLLTINKNFKNSTVTLAICLLLIAGVGSVSGATRIASVSGNWSSMATWGGAAVPTSIDDVTINNGITLTVDAATANCNSITTVNTGTLTINGTNSLNVTGLINILRPSTSGTNFTVNVNSGSITSGSLTMSATTTTRNNIINITTGTLTINGALNTGTSGCQINITGSGNLNINGAFTSNPTITTSAGSTVTYGFAGNQTVDATTYSNLILSGSGAKTLQTGTTINGNLSLLGTATTAAVANLTIGGDVIIGAGTTFAAGAFTHNVAGNWTNNGGTFTPGTGTITFNGSNTTAINGTAGTQTFNNIIVNKTAGQDLNVSGSTTTLNVGGTFTETLGDFNAPATMTVGSDVTLTSGTFFAGTLLTMSTGNWINNGGAFIGGIGTVTMIGSTTITKTIGGTFPTVFSNLTFGDGNGQDFSLGYSETINGILTLKNNSLLTLGSNNLTLGAAASISIGTPYNACMIVADGTGELRKIVTGNGSFTFPIGDNTSGADYSPVTLNFTNGTYAMNAYVSVRVTDAKQPANLSPTHYLTRYWTVNQFGISACKYDFTGTSVYASDNQGWATSSLSAIYSGGMWTTYSMPAGDTFTISGINNLFGDITTVENTPVINTSVTSLSGLSYAFGSGPSAQQSFAVSGYAVGTNIVLTAPTDYEISTTSGSGFTNSIILSSSATNVATTTIYVRLKAGLAINTYTENIVLTSGATTKNISASGMVYPAPCPFAGNTTSSITIIPVINMPTNVIPVSTNLSTNKYFVLNVIKGLTYQIYTCSAPTQALKMSVFDDLTSNFIATSISNTGNTCSANINDVYLSFVSPLSGQVRVLLNTQADCTSSAITGITVNVNVSTGSNTQDNPNAAGSNVWIGHIYDGAASFTNYLGYYNVGTETFQEMFGTTGTFPNGADNDLLGFNVYSNGAIRSSVMDVTFSVRYRMNSTKRGLWTFDTASDDGVRLTVDGVLQYSHWNDQSPTINTNMLISLTGNSSLVLDYYENAGQNVIGFYNLKQLISNYLTSHTVQTICLGNSITGQSIGGDLFSALPTGLSLNGTGYQWTYSTTPNGIRIPISGATGATFTPGTSSPFNVPGTYYVYRNASLNSTYNATTPVQNGDPFNANETNESNAAIITIQACNNYWIGGNSVDWGTGTNWKSGYIPAIGDDVEYATNANNSNVPAMSDLVLDQTRIIGSLINLTSHSLTIPAGRGLTVNNTITTDGNPGRIYIKSSQSAPTLPSGSLIFHNDPVTQPVNATVEMYSKAKKATVAPPIVDGAQDWYSWQYFGIPLTSVNADPTFYGSYLQQQFENGDYDHKWGALTNLSTLQPFTGYAITQDNPITIVFSGQLVNSNLTSYLLPYTSGAYFAGQSLLANPYTAAIDINQLVFGANTQQTVYLYNTGSYGEWYGNAGSSGNSNGQYLAIPKNATPVGSLPNDIPSMSGFMVNATAVGGSITINYSSVINNVNPQRAPSASKSSSSDKTYIEIALNGEHTSDRMWLIDQPGTTHGFDNGWDGYKYSGALGTPMLFAMEDSGNYQVSTSDDLNNTYLGFQAGVDLEDTLTFKHENIELKYDGLYLVDLVENKVVDISKSGTQYSFKAESTVSPVKRFKIVTEPYVKGAADQTTQLKVFNDNETVFVDNPGNEKGELYFYDIMGRYLKKEVFGANSISSFSVFSKSGAYVVRAITSSEKVSKRIIVNYQGE